MSLAPTLYDFQIALSHVDRALDQPQLGLKVARHPSETMQRVWLRVLAFCWLWEERMAFGKGLGEPEAPDLECRDYTGLVTSWVRVGKTKLPSGRTLPLAQIWSVVHTEWPGVTEAIVRVQLPT